MKNYEDDVLENFEVEDNTEVGKALKRYSDIIGDDFPTIPLLRDYTDEEVINMIEACIKEKKDVVEMGYYKIDNEIMY